MHIYRNKKKRDIRVQNHTYFCEFCTRYFRYAIVAAGMGIMLLSGCGNKNKAEIALITDAQGMNEQTSEYSALAGVKKFAEKNNKTYDSFASEEKSTRGYEETISKALKSGAEVIICQGKELETAVYDMQKADLSVKFVLLDGVPHAADSEKEKLRGNTHAVLFSREQAGYLAGYSAVREGFTSLGFMGGEKEDSTIQYGSGFVLGANEAAKEIGLGAEQITIRYRYLGTEITSPDVEQTAQSWYNEGCQVISSCEFSILNAIGKAAKQKDKQVITMDNSLEAFPGTVLTYVGNDYASVTYQILNSIKEKSYAGGEREIVGVDTNSVCLDMNKSSFQTFTADQYNQLCEELSNGKLEVSRENVTKDLKKYKIVNVTLNMENNT